MSTSSLPIQLKFDKMAKDGPEVEILLSVPGISYTTTAIINGELPEIGKVSRNKIAKLVTIVNVMVKRGTKWDDTKKGDERVTSSPPTCSIGS